MTKEQLQLMKDRDRKIQEANSYPDSFEYENKLNKIQEEYKEALMKIITKH